MVRKTKESTEKQPNEVMVVNDLPGEECRIAILEGGHLEELYSERTANATDVGNIYKGRVTNVEAAIQAAFVDYGRGQSGFLHISDLHPRYFPGKERTERVGRKISRRERPPIQEALKRGQEILVQVLKEGIGTKGPTLTSYLSIPGRMLVLMPYMDQVGVSRKIEDDERRRQMRDTLKSLELPDKFGFILRTAGIGRPKTELKRDVAYLMRLWKAIMRRHKATGAPCELYTESDLLVRTIRDVLRPSISAIVVDSESAYERATAFLQVVAPRSAPKVVHYQRRAPIFHAFDVERQIELIHSRSVPLPSGGSLVIDQTEALVAIDVNSGRSRTSRDSETNAFHTNCEAVDEISRQLRLRDLGGLIVLDLIDMRATRHRRGIEDRLKEHLKSDRARTTTLKVSEFGMIEMTRQRMRPSMRSSHFTACPHCRGLGEVKAAHTVASDAVRTLGYLLQFDRVRRLEVVCPARVASELLSGKRRTLVRLEDDSGKSIDVRVSDSLPPDRVDYYAYDDRNADIEIDLLPAPKQPTIEELEREDQTTGERSAADTATAGQTGRKKRRRRRKPAPADATAIAIEGADEDFDETADEQPAESQPSRSKRKRSRRRGGSKRQETPKDEPKQDEATAAQPPVERADQPKKKRRSRRKAGAKDGDASGPLRVHELAKEIGVSSKEIVNRAESDDNVQVKSHMSSVSTDEAAQIREWFVGSEEDSEETADAPQKKRRRRGRRGGRKHRRRRESAETAATDAAESSKSAADGAPKTTGEPAEDGAARRDGEAGSTDAAETKEPAPRKRRALYRRRTRVSPTARELAEQTETTQ